MGFKFGWQLKDNPLHPYTLSLLHRCGSEAPHGNISAHHHSSIAEQRWELSVRSQQYPWLSQTHKSLWELLCRHGGKRQEERWRFEEGLKKNPDVRANFFLSIVPQGNECIGLPSSHSRPFLLVGKSKPLIHILPTDMTMGIYIY